MPPPALRRLFPRRVSFSYVAGVLADLSLTVTRLRINGKSRYSAATGGDAAAADGVFAREIVVVAVTAFFSRTE